MSEELAIVFGHVYEAKRPARVGASPKFWNDRQITWVGKLEVQYDSPAVATGRHYPKITIAKFLEWAGRDITDEMPENRDWRIAP